MYAQNIISNISFFEPKMKSITIEVRIFNINLKTNSFANSKISIMRWVRWSNFQIIKPNKAALGLMFILLGATSIKLAAADPFFLIPYTSIIQMILPLFKVPTLITAEFLSMSISWIQRDISMKSESLL